MAGSNILLRAAKKMGITGAASIALVLLGLWFRAGAPFVGESWPLVKIGLVFVFMVTLLRHKVSVGVVLLLSAVVLGAMFSLAPGHIARVVVFDAAGPNARLHELLFKAVVLTAVIFGINALGLLLDAAGAMRRLIHALDDLLRDGRCVMAAIPAAIGLLPMPGGAMLSAPFVGEMGERLQVGPEDKTIVNYWFRHIFEYAWPLYPAVIIAADAAGKTVEVGDVMVAHAPMVLASVLVGSVFLFTRLERGSLGMGRRDTLGSNLLAIVRAVWPVAVVAAVVGLTPRVAQGRTEALLFPAALAAVSLAVAFTAGLTRAQVADAARKSFSWRTVLLVLGIYVLRGMFEEARVTDDMPGLLAGLGAPGALIIFIVPFMVGLLTGYNVASVSTSLPALAALGLLSTPGHLLIAYCGSFFGVMLSPMHLCLMLTRDYFKAHLGKIYLALGPMVLAMLCVMAGYSMLLMK